MDCIVAKSQTRLCDFHFFFFFHLIVGNTSRYTLV